MPTDDTNPITGVDADVALLFNGLPQRRAKIERFTAKASTQKTESRPLGSTSKHIDVIPDGWEGTFEVHERNSAMDDLYDAYLLAKRTRVPVVLVLTQAKKYKDGTVRKHTYLNVQITDFEASYERGSNVKQQISWATGDDRISN
ncbi:MAG: hypothetical protein RJA59_1190 [Pseudomonadota bacterium]|jgi:hypothetical protein